MSRDADRRLVRRAHRQNNVFTRQQALAEGVPESTIGNRVRAGAYEVLHPCVYKLAVAPDSFLTRVTAAVFAWGSGAVLSHRSAAHLWGLRGCRAPDEIDVLVARRRRTATAVRHVRGHTTRHLPPTQVTVHDNVAVTTVARTLWDLAACVPLAALRDAVVDGVRRGLTTVEELREIGAGLGRVRGTRTMRRALDELDPQEARIRSDAEALFPRLMRQAGLPEPVMNHAVRDANGDLRYLDAAFLAEKIPVEIDTPAFHGLPTDRNDDLKRENAIVLIDWRSFLRFTLWQLENEPEVVVATVRVALGAARREADDDADVDVRVRRPILGASPDIDAGGRGRGALGIGGRRPRGEAGALVGRGMPAAGGEGVSPLGGEGVSRSGRGGGGRR